MLQFLKCLFGFHGVTEIYHCKDGELKVCRDCLKVKKQPNVLRHIKPCRILDVDGVFLFLLVVNMAYIVVAFVSFIIGYALCFKWFQQDIIEGKPIVFNKGIYVATKKKIEP